MPRVHLLSRYRPNDPDPAFFEAIEDWIADLGELGIELHFMEERDLSPNSRQWRWMTLCGERLELIACDDLTFGSREIRLNGAQEHIDLGLPLLHKRLPFEPYAEALQKVVDDPNSAVALLRACVASPWPPEAKLKALIEQALNSEDVELRYRAVSACALLQTESMVELLRARVRIESDERVLGLLRRSIEALSKLSLYRDGA